MKSLYVFLLPTLLAVSLSAQDGPYQPQGKIPEDFSFKKCDEDDKECLESRTSFMKQYAVYHQNAPVKTIVINVVSDVAMTLVHQKIGRDIHIIIKDISRD